MIKAQTSKGQRLLWPGKESLMCTYYSQRTSFNSANTLFQQVILIVFIQLQINNFTLWVDNLKLPKLQGTLPKQRKKTR